MGLFDNLKNKVINETKNVFQFDSNKSEDIVFNTLPENLEQFKALPQAALASPFDTAALTVLALAAYPGDKDVSISMLNYLRGPVPMSEYDKQFIKDRFSDKDYVPRSYFKGATPQNDYTPSEPYTVNVSTNPYSKVAENTLKLFVTSGGADSKREIEVRLAKDGKWYLVEQFILSDIRKPESQNPWA